MLERRVEQAEQLVSHYSQKLSVGEVGQLAFSQSNLQLTALTGELEGVRSDISTNQAALEELTGGTAVQVTDTLLPPYRPVDPDTLMAAYSQGALMQYFQREVDLREQKKNLSASLCLPKISAGYYSESVVTQQFRGFQLGISVPLWEHSNQIKLARSEVLYAEADAERATTRQHKELTERLQQRESLDLRIRHLEEALSLVNDIELLHLAWEGGEISLAELMVGSDLYFRNLETLMTYKRDRLLVEAELMRVYY
jgi:cobalt-zinc-cadmium efflux system outer membrane protein